MKLKKSTRQPYHLVKMSPWPLTGSLGGLMIALSLVMWFHMTNFYILPFAILVILVTMLCWWRDVIREATYSGDHTLKVQKGLEWGMILFITSEVMFFSAFFWAFFHSSLAPTFELGCSWPPTGIWPLNPFSIPLLNTAVLLSSGVTVTYAHHALLFYKNSEVLTGLALTVILGAYFTSLQAIEYMETSFSFADSTYGSTFFIATGFHGLHVIIGSLFLLTCLMRASRIQLSKNHHFGFEAAAWYWHFVDVVWIFLFLSMYWWATN
uniref:Cytochrome c oxidase subunit 3 n=1 Tax=Typosyllis antoni TaxID=1898412 RepID=A0A1C9UZF4_9ANNE|nr:cytochrome c oxidase subunit III [Typosyllis antoni]AOR87148.1 cytochrome c oxidase subunit III [Typosyllis antoni]